MGTAATNRKQANKSATASKAASMSTQLIEDLIPDDVTDSGRKSSSVPFLTNTQVVGQLTYEADVNCVSSWKKLKSVVRDKAPQVFTYSLGWSKDSGECFLSINVPKALWARVTDNSDPEFVKVTNWAVEQDILRLGFTADGQYRAISKARQLGGAKQLIKGNSRQGQPTWTDMDYVLSAVSNNLKLDHQSLVEFVKNELSKLDTSSLPMTGTNGLLNKDVAAFSKAQ